MIRGCQTFQKLFFILFILRVYLRIYLPVKAVPADMADQHSSERSAVRRPELAALHIESAVPHRLHFRIYYKILIHQEADFHNCYKTYSPPIDPMNRISLSSYRDKVYRMSLAIIITGYRFIKRIITLTAFIVIMNLILFRTRFISPIKLV